MNPYEPPTLQTDEVANKARLALRLATNWWFLPIVFAAIFTLPVFIFGVAILNQNPLDLKWLVLQGLGNFVAGALGGLVVVVYVRFRLRKKVAIIAPRDEPH